VEGTCECINIKYGELFDFYEHHLASEEGLCSIELVSLNVAELGDILNN
jgi:hypothetical protein